MSARHRPQRRVRGREREALRATWLPTMLARIDRSEESATWLIWMRAGRIGCRPAQLRRCLLGLPVSTRAAARILAAVTR